MWEIVQKGGPLMWPIIFCSVLGLALFFERLWFYQRFRRGDVTLSAEVEELTRAGRIDDATVACRKAGSPLSHIYLAALRCAGQERARIKTVVEEIGSRELAPLDRYLGLMGTIATLTPLLGLLGTVLGMIRAFNVIASAGVGTPATLGGGISEALITTAAGLAVAIPTILLHKYLSSRADRIALETEVRALHLVDLLGK